MDNPLTEDPEVPESSSNVEEEAEDEEVDDEGFVDADINVEDMTVPFPPGMSPWGPNIFRIINIQSYCPFPARLSL